MNFPCKFCKLKTGQQCWWFNKAVTRFWCPIILLLGLYTLHSATNKLKKARLSHGIPLLSKSGEPTIILEAIQYPAVALCRLVFHWSPCNMEKHLSSWEVCANHIYIPRYISILPISTCIHIPAHLYCLMLRTSRLLLAASAKSVNWLRMVPQSVGWTKPQEVGETLPQQRETNLKKWSLIYVFHLDTKVSTIVYKMINYQHI